MFAKDTGLYPEGIVSGYFGVLTERAVGRFQKRYGIARPGESGYGQVGPKTRAKLNGLAGATPPTAAIPPGAFTGEEAAKIRALQEQLRLLQEQLRMLQSR